MSVEIKLGDIGFNVPDRTECEHGSLKRKCRICELETELDAVTKERDEARIAIETPMIKRIQPCGCVTCICNGHERCYGCGAKNCRSDDCVFMNADSRARIEYEDSPSYAQLRRDLATYRQVVRDLLPSGMAEMVEERFLELMEGG